MILLCQIFGTLLKSLDKMFMKISKYHIISVLEAPSLSVIFVVIHTPVKKYIVLSCFHRKYSIFVYRSTSAEYGKIFLGLVSEDR